MSARALALDISEIDDEAERGDQQELDDAHRTRNDARRQQIETSPAPDLGEARSRSAASLEERHIRVG